MKRRKQNQVIHPGRSVVAMILLFLLLFHSLPIAFAAGAVESDESLSPETSSTGNTALGEKAEEQTYVELDELRETFVKHFQREDGQRVAVVYPEAVHTLVDGEMQDIDNRLVFDAASSAYRTLNPNFAVSFAESCAADEAVSITFDGYTVSWRVDVFRNTVGITPRQGSVLPMGQSLAEASTEKASSLAVASLTQSEFVTAEKGKLFSKAELGTSFASVAGLRYANAFTGNGSVELRYTVSENRVEEDIILNEKNNIRSYIMQMTAEGLTATKLADDSIAFVDEKGETVFTIGAPWMSDAVGAFSCDITVSLAQKGSEVVVAYTPDEEWLNADERVYPILIDPSVRTKNYTANYEDTTISSAGYQSRFAQDTFTRAGMLASNGTHYETYTRFLNLPQIDTTMQVTGVTMTYYSSSSNTDTQLAILDGNANQWTVDTLRYNGDQDADATTVHPRGTQGVYRSVSAAVSSGVYGNTFDLTNAFLARGNTYGTMNQFLQNQFHGFRLFEDPATATGTARVYYSSEYSNAAYRPYLEITYTYTPYLPMVNNGVYSIQNQNSGMRITAPSSSTNAFQMADTHGNNQAFRLIGGDGIFTIQPIARSGEALTWDYAGLSVEQTAVNLYSAALSSSNADKQEFLIRYVEDDSNGYPYFAIVSRADINMALTAYGTSTGSATGTTVTSRGNVYVSEYTGDASQLWCFYSGGMPCLVGNDIVEENGAVMDIILGVNTKLMQPFCYVTDFGDTIDWSTSDSISISIDANGKIDVKNVGSVVLSATVKNSSGIVKNTYSYKVIVRLANGVYYIKNEYTGKYLDATGFSIADGSDVVQSNKITTGDARLGQLWKIYYIGDGSYSIRPMRKLNMGLNVSDLNVDIRNLGTSDTQANVIDNAEWDFKSSNAYGYRIQQKGDNSKTLSLSGDDVCVNSYNGYVNQFWRFEQVSAPNGILVYNMVDGVACGSSVHMIAAPYSGTSINQNVSWSSSNSSVISVTNAGVLTSVNPGIARITITSGILSKSFLLMSNYTMEGPSNIIPDTMIQALNQPYNVWPAGEESDFCDLSDDDRWNQLYYIYLSASTIDVSSFVYPTACDMISHYLSNSGNAFVVDFSDMIDKNEDIKNNRNYDLNALMRVVEILSTEQSYGIVRTMRIVDHDEPSSGTDWHYAINKYYTSVEMSYSKQADGSFFANVTYQMYDVYDWDANNENRIAGIVSPSEMWELHYGGWAKNYQVTGVSYLSLSWTLGQIAGGSGVSITVVD